MRLNKILVIITALFCILTANAATITATDVMNKASTNIRNAKGINCGFTLSSGGNKMSGTLKSSGAKFSMITPAASSWYNGKYLWSYNASSKETTLVTPSAMELREANPLEYIKGYSAHYTAAFSKKKVSGKYVISLIPKKKNNEIKSLQLILNSKTLKPESLMINLKSGVSSTITINSIDYGANFPASAFEYPKSKFPKVQIVDLR